MWSLTPALARLPVPERRLDPHRPELVIFDDAFAGLEVDHWRSVLPNAAPSARLASVRQTLHPATHAGAVRIDCYRRLRRPRAATGPGELWSGQRDMYRTFTVMAPSILWLN
jgi:hypothetical protein